MIRIALAFAAAGFVVIAALSCKEAPAPGATSPLPPAPATPGNAEVPGTPTPAATTPGARPLPESPPVPSPAAKDPCCCDVNGVFSTVAMSKCVRDLNGHCVEREKCGTK